VFKCPWFTVLCRYIFAISFRLRKCYRFVIILVFGAVSCINCTMLQGSSASASPNRDSFCNRTGPVKCHSPLLEM
ncbi:hypothetical protein DPEC_G00214250, partial [Dallia pectoralis]